MHNPNLSFSHKWTGRSAVEPLGVEVDQARQACEKLLNHLVCCEVDADMMFEPLGIFDFIFVIEAEAGKAQLNHLVV